MYIKGHAHLGSLAGNELEYLRDSNWEPRAPSVLLDALPRLLNESTMVVVCLPGVRYDACLAIGESVSPNYTTPWEIPFMCGNFVSGSPATATPEILKLFGFPIANPRFKSNDFSVS